MKTSLAIAFLLCSVSLGSAQTAARSTLTPLNSQETQSQKGSFFQRSEEGWFWYDDPKDLLEILEAIAETEQVIPPAKEDKTETTQPEQKLSVEIDHVEPFSVTWLRANMPILLDRAIDNPTQKNVEAYEYAKRIALDKAQNYAQMTKHVVTNDPYLDENNRVPLATFAKMDFLGQQKRDLTEAMEYLSKRVGIWMFFDSTCSFCHLQAQSILSIKREFGFNTTFISLTGEGMPFLEEWRVDQGHAKALGLTITPTTVVVVPPNRFFIVSQGAMAIDQLQERILLAADSNGLLPDELRKGMNAFNKGVLTTEDLNSGATDDPSVWVDRLKQRLQIRY